MPEYEDELQEVDSLVCDLKSLKEKTKKIERSNIGRPPTWSEDINDLKKFKEKYREWIEEPKLRKIKNIIEDFIDNVTYERDLSKFNINNNSDYYISVLEDLNYAKDVIEQIEHNVIEDEAIKNVLNMLYSTKPKEELNNEIENIENYWDTYCEKISSFSHETPFEKIVKENQVESIIESIRQQGFKEKMINNAYKKINKAKNTLETLPEVDQKAFQNEYENKNKDIESIWDKTESIRESLNELKLKLEWVPESPKYKLFKELKNFNSEKNASLNKPNLTEINDNLDNIIEGIEKWEKKVKHFIDEDITQINFWLKTIGNKSSEINEENEFSQEKLDKLQDEFKNFEDKKIKDINLQELYKTFKEYYKIRNQIEEILEDMLSEPAGKIFKSPSDANKLKEELGDDFWDGLKEVTAYFPNVRIEIKL